MASLKGGRSKTLESPRGTLQGVLFAPEITWQPPDLGTLPDWRDAKRVAIDVETKDENLKELGPGCRRPGNFVCGYSFAIEDGPKHYVPIRHLGGSNVDAAQALSYLRTQAKNFRGTLVGMNMQYDLDWLATEDIHFNPEWYRDVMIAEPLIDELQNSYSLRALAERYKLPGKQQSKLEEAARAHGVDPKGGMWKLPGHYVGEYGEQDAALPLTILRRQEKHIEEQNLWQVFNLESKVLPVLVKMRRRGVRFSWERLRQVENWTLKEEEAALGRVRDLTGIRIPVGDVWKSALVAQALQAIGVNVPTTGAGKASIQKDYLSKIDHEVARLLERARKVNKLRTTFAQSIRTYAVGDRIHCTFNQLRASKDENDDSEGSHGGRFGRLSSEDPNLQQQPARDELAKGWRKIYLPDEGGLWASNDYSQQEPRWLVHFAELCQLPKAAEAAARYRDDPNTDNHDMMTRMIYGAEVDTWDKDKYKRMRGFCKEIYLGKCYGMGGAKLCKKLKLPTAWTILWEGPVRAKHRGEQPRFATRAEAVEALSRDPDFMYGSPFEVAGAEGQAILDKFDYEAPFVKGIARIAQGRAARNGYITTVLGRRCRFPLLTGDEDGLTKRMQNEGRQTEAEYDWTHKALNRLIQGCSADQTKQAMVDLDAAGFPVQLQVHDEICFTAESKEQAIAAAQVMRDCVPANVPFKVDVEVGPSWGEAA